MNDAPPFDDDAVALDSAGDVVLDARGRLALYLAVGLGRRLGDRAADRHHARVLGRQLGAFRLAGGVSLAMLGFGLTSAVMCVAKDWFQRNWRGAATVALGLFGPLAVGANLYVQQLGFNADLPGLRSRAEVEAARRFSSRELTPFLAGAVFLGCVFLKSNRTFGRVYFADLAGSGLCGLVFLGAMYRLHAGQPDRRAAGAVARRLRRLGFRPGRRGAPSLRSSSSAASPSAVISSSRRTSACRASRSTTTRASPTPANSRTRSGSTRARRRSAISRPIRARICISRRASPTTPASTCRTMPANAYLGALHRQRRPDRHHARSHRTRRRPISVSCRCTTPM